MTATKQIDAYVATLPEWQHSMVVRLRAIVHHAVPDIVEEWKWGTPVFSRGGNLCAIGAFKDHLKVSFFKGASVADPDGLFNSGFEAKSSRTIDLREGDPLDDDALARLIRRAAGG